MQKVGYQELYAALVLAWDKDTAFGQWSELCPDLHQCVPTALVVQDFFGGDLLWCRMTDGDKHLWNRLEDGTEIDFTRAQFDFVGAYPVRTGKKKANRKSLFRVQHVKRRYKLLCQRVNEQLVDGRDHEKE